jgi:hypothetical protein
MRARTKLFSFGFIFIFMASSVSYGGLSITGGLTQEKKAGIGETYNGSILIKNTFAEAQEVKIYQTDYTFFFDGSNHYDPPGQMERSNADWLAFAPRRLVIPPGDTLTVNYTVKVPNDPNLVGTYWSMLMVEGVPKNSAESSQKKLNQPGIVQVIRYGVQIVTNIGDTGERNLKFLDTKVIREDKARFAQVDVENAGQRWLKPALWLELYGENGSYAGKFEAGVKRIYPNTSVRYKLDLTDLPDGSYKALLVADAGGDNVFGADYNLKFGK